MFKKIFLFVFVFFLVFSFFSIDGIKANTVSLVNPLGGTATKPVGTTDPKIIIGTVINQALGIVGSIALLVFVYGGVTWMMAMGNDQQITKGKDILIWATVGIILIFSSYVLVKFVIEAISG